MRPQDPEIRREITARTEAKLAGQKDPHPFRLATLGSPDFWPQFPSSGRRRFLLAGNFRGGLEGFEDLAWGNDLLSALGERVRFMRISPHGQARRFVIPAPAPSPPPPGARCAAPAGAGLRGTLG